MPNTSPPAGSYAKASIDSFHADVLDSLHTALGQHEVVVVGMGWNPHVRRARRALDDAGIAYHYLGFGNYLTGWKPRLAIKMWTRWPTFPQVFVDGRLLGGANQVEKALEAGVDGLKASVQA